MTKDKVTITIDKDINAKLREYSKNEHRSFSQTINMILAEYIKAKEGE